MSNGHQEAGQAATTPQLRGEHHAWHGVLAGRVWGGDGPQQAPVAEAPQACVTVLSHWGGKESRYISTRHTKLLAHPLGRGGRRLTCQQQPLGFTDMQWQVGVLVLVTLVLPHCLGDTDVPKLDLLTQTHTELLLIRGTVTLSSLLYTRDSHEDTGHR